MTGAALELGESRYINGSISKDPFYTCFEDRYEAPAGTLLKLEDGVDKSSYMLHPATAMVQPNGILCSAQAAFPQLSKNLVVIGHSQGEGGAWATAKRQVVKLVDGYLGAVAVSPGI